LGAALTFTIVPRHVLGRMGRGTYTPPSDRITLGYIGTGKQSRDLVRSFAPKAEALAASDVDAQKLELFKKVAVGAYAKAGASSSNQGLTPYADFRQLLDRKDIDAVVVAMPDHWHAVATIMAANAGKHVYCEKPLAHTVEEGRAMVNAVAKNRIILQTGSM
jgi:predicted dehydrogenase